MQQAESGYRQKSPCSIKNNPVPETAQCPKCGDEVEFWTDDDQSVCSGCGHKIIRK